MLNYTRANIVNYMIPLFISCIVILIDKGAVATAIKATEKSW